MVRNTQLSDQLRKTVKRRPRSKSCLARYRKTPIVSNPGTNDGVDHINVSTSGNTELGVRLSLCHNRPFKHPFGTFRSMDVFMNYINTVGFPEKLLNPSMTGCVRSRIEKMKKRDKHIRRVHVPNFWAIVTEATWYRLEKDIDTLKLLAESEEPFTSYHIVESKADMLDSDVTVKRVVYHTEMARYLGILKEIRGILKNAIADGGELGDDETMSKIKEDIKKLVKDAMDVPEKHLYSGVPFITIEESSESTDNVDDADVNTDAVETNDSDTESDVNDESLESDTDSDNDETDVDEDDSETKDDDDDDTTVVSPLEKAYLEALKDAEVPAEEIKSSGDDW